VEDDEGSTNSSEITIIVGEVDTAPAVSFTSPTDGSEYMEGDNVLVVAVASDPNGEIANVKFYLNDNFIRQENVTPYEWGHLTDMDPELKNMAPGTYTLRVEAEDNDGEITVAEITIIVSPVTSTTDLLRSLVSIRPTVSASTVTLLLPPQLLNKTYQVFDLNGKKVKTVRPQQEVSVMRIGDLPSGMYFIAIGRVSYRFVRR